MIQRGFIETKPDSETIQQLQERARLARGDILTMTTLAGCGHPGGSMSSLEMYITLFGCAAVQPDDPRNPDRDRIVISHGHTSPGAYAALARTGFFPPDDVLVGFRTPGSIFEGHVERGVCGIEWASGNLGQGLSAGCGFALAARLTNKSYKTYVVMGDGEQQKGQIAEARRFAIKYNLSDITALIDYNQLQISGNIHDIMPQNIRVNFESDGWKVLEIDGHDISRIYSALYEAAKDPSVPYAIIAHTTMGRGVSFMENVEKYHGVALSEQQWEEGMRELGLSCDISSYKKRRAGNEPRSCQGCSVEIPTAGTINTGAPVTYGPESNTSNRSAFGSALKQIAEINKDIPDSTPCAVLDCDLVGSVKANGFASVRPDQFFQAGIQEHNATTIAGVLSIEGIITYFCDFGVFGVCETYNQHRLNDINRTGLKLVCTHIGLDVGEDGKTHQCIDYIGLIRNLFGYKIIIPADPNQTDRATRFITETHGNFLLGMGRSNTPVILDTDGKPFYGEGYTFRYGAVDVIRPGDDAAIITCGSMVHRALSARDMLSRKGIQARILNAASPCKLDIKVIAEAAETGLIITYEDHAVQSGLGTIVADTLLANGLAPALRKMGITRYGLSGKPDDIYAAAGLSPEALADTVAHAVSGKKIRSSSLSLESTA